MTRENEGEYLVTDLKITEDRNRAIGNAVSQIEKQFGKGSIMRMGDEEPRRKVASIEETVEETFEETLAEL